MLNLVRKINLDGSNGFKSNQNSVIAFNEQFICYTFNGISIALLEYGKQSTKVYLSTIKLYINTFLLL